LRLEFDYSLTLFRASSSFAVPAFHGDLRTPGLGICETEINGTGTAMKLRCRQAGNSTKCRSAFLEDTATGQHNPEMYICKPDYSPSKGVRRAMSAGLVGGDRYGLKQVWVVTLVGLRLGLRQSGWPLCGLRGAGLFVGKPTVGLAPHAVD
jgi:hypothetical protein